MRACPEGKNNAIPGLMHHLHMGTPSKNVHNLVFDKCTNSYAFIQCVKIPLENAVKQPDDLLVRIMCDSEFYLPQELSQSTFITSIWPVKLCPAKRTTSN